LPRNGKRIEIVSFSEGVLVTLVGINSLSRNFRNTDFQHAPHMDEFSVIGSATNDYHLKIKESLLINKLKPSFNSQGDSIALLLFNN